MPSVEITSNAINFAVPMKLSGNLGIGTSIPQYPLHMDNTPLAFGITQTPVAEFQIGSSDARYISCSADGNVVVVGKANSDNNGKIYVNTYSGSNWSVEELFLPEVPADIYPPDGVYAWRSGARGFVSNDGTRIVAARGMSSGYNANAATIFEKVNNVWTSTALFHKAGSFGYGCAISGDGNTVAFTAPYGSVNNYSGYIYSFKYNASTQVWDETLARSYENWPDQISLNYDGTVLAFTRTHFPPDLANTFTYVTAYAHVLKYTNNAWNSINDDVIISSNGLNNWHFYGKTVCLSGDGTTLVVGAPGFVEWGLVNSLNAVYVYKSMDGWIQRTEYKLQPPSYISPSFNDYNNHFGNAIAVNSSGTEIVVGAHASLVGTLTKAGRVWVFQFINNTWNATGSIDGTSTNLWFGSAVALMGNSMSAYIVARNWNNSPTARGVTKYTFMAPGTAINISDGNMHLTGDMAMTGKMNVTGTIQATNFLGDGSQLTNLPKPLGTARATIAVTIGQTDGDWYQFATLNIASIVHVTVTSTYRYKKYIVSTNASDYNWRVCLPISSAGQTYNDFEVFRLENFQNSFRIVRVGYPYEEDYQCTIHMEAYTSVEYLYDSDLNIQVENITGSGATNFGIHSSTLLTQRTSNGEGRVGIGTEVPLTALTVNGTIRNINGPGPTSGTSLVITGDGDIAPQSSDARYKTNVQDLPSVIDAMMNMRAVSYTWKDEPQKWYGLLAQQISEVFPDAAWHNADNDTYGVHYTPTVVTLLLKAVQEQQQMIKAMTERIAALENK